MRSLAVMDIIPHKLLQEILYGVITMKLYFIPPVFSDCALRLGGEDIFRTDIHVKIRCQLPVIDGLIFSAGVHFS
jgi:hypothetical protein